MLMIKKLLLRSLAIAVIVFLWQFISHAAANLHGSSQQYLAKQDTIMAFLKSMDIQQGEYLLPQIDPNKPNPSMSDWEPLMGKPWLFLRYYESRQNVMGISLLRGFITDWIFGLILLMVLSSFGPVNLKKSMGLCMAIAIMNFIVIPYTNHIWYPKADILVSLLDCVLPMLMIAFLNARYWHPETMVKAA